MPKYDPISKTPMYSVTTQLPALDCQLGPSWSLWRATLNCAGICWTLVKEQTSSTTQTSMLNWTKINPSVCLYKIWVQGDAPPLTKPVASGSGCCCGSLPSWRDYIVAGVPAQPTCGLHEPRPTTYASWTDPNGSYRRRMHPSPMPCAAPTEWGLVGTYTGWNFPCVNPNSRDMFISVCSPQSGLGIRDGIGFDIFTRQSAATTPAATTDSCGREKRAVHNNENPNGGSITVIDYFPGDPEITGFCPPYDDLGIGPEDI